MATPLTVQVIITAKDAATAVLNRFGSAVSKTAQSIKTHLEAAQNGLVAVGAAASGFLAKAVFTAARTETLGVAMKAVAKATNTSTELLAEQEKTLKDLGITTQEARSTLTKFMQSQLDVTEASKLARVAQDLAVIAGENSSQTTARLTDFVVSGNIELLKAVGITGSLDKIYGEYAKTLGKTAEQLDETEKSTARLSFVFESGIPVAGTYEAAMGTAGKKLESLKRHIEEAANAIGEPFIPMLNFGVDALTDLLKGLQDNAGAADTLAGALAGLATVGIVASAAKLVTFLGLLNPVYLVLSALAITIGIVAANWKNFNDNLRTFADILESRRAFNILASIFGPLGYLFSTLSALVGGPGGRQAGGFVSAGSPVTVGEGGPEVFVPPVSGMIEPRGGGGSPVTLNVNVGLYAGTETEKRRIAETLYEQLARVAEARKMTVEEAFAI